MDIIYPKGNKVPEKVNDKNDDDQGDSSSSNESEDSLDDDNSQGSDLLYKSKNGIKYKKSAKNNKVCEVQQEKGPRKLLQRAAYAFCTMAK